MKRRRGAASARQGRTRLGELEATQDALRQALRREAALKRDLADSEAASEQMLHRRLGEVDTKRAGGARPFPRGFEALVSILREASEPRPRPAGAASPASAASAASRSLCGADASRSDLREKQAEVRRAAAGEELVAAVLARNEGRRRHVKALQEAQEAVLHSVGSGSLEKLEDDVIAADLAFSRADTALAAAREAVTAAPQLGARALPPRNSEGEIDSSAPAAVRAYQDYLRACSSEHVVAATDRAVLLVRAALRGTLLFLPGKGLRPGVMVSICRNGFAGTCRPAGTAPGVTQEPRLATEQPVFLAGQVVKAAGLQSQSGRLLNGVRGVVVRRLSGTGRYEVRFGEERIVALSPENIVVTSQAGAGPDKRDQNELTGESGDIESAKRARPSMQTYPPGGRAGGDTARGVASRDDPARGGVTNKDASRSGGDGEADGESPGLLGEPEKATTKAGLQGPAVMAVADGGLAGDSVAEDATVPTQLDAQKICEPTAEAESAPVAEEAEGGHEAKRLRHTPELDAANKQVPTSGTHSADERARSCVSGPTSAEAMLATTPNEELAPEQQGQVLEHCVGSFAPHATDGLERLTSNDQSCPNGNNTNPCCAAESGASGSVACGSGPSGSGASGSGANRSGVNRSCAGSSANCSSGAIGTSDSGGTARATTCAGAIAGEGNGSGSSTSREATSNSSGGGTEGSCMEACTDAQFKPQADPPAELSLEASAPSEGVALCPSDGNGDGVTDLAGYAPAATLGLPANDTAASTPALSSPMPLAAEPPQLPAQPLLLPPATLEGGEDSNGANAACSCQQTSGDVCTTGEALQADLSGDALCTQPLALSPRLPEALTVAGGELAERTVDVAAAPQSHDQLNERPRPRGARYSDGDPGIRPAEEVLSVACLAPRPPDSQTPSAKATEVPGLPLTGHQPQAPANAGLAMDVVVIPSEDDDEERAEVISVHDGGAVVRFENGALETISSTQISSILEGDSAAMNAHVDTVRKARASIDAEASFWQGLDQVAAMPCAQLLAAARGEVAIREGLCKALRAAREKYAALQGERLDEEEALAPERSRDPAVAFLGAAAEAHLDAGDALQDASQALHRARVRGRPVAPLEDAAALARAAAKRADAEVKRAMVGLAEAMRRFPEVGSDPVVLKHLRISLPQDLLPLWRVGRTMAHFDTRELLPGASRHRLYSATEVDRKYAVKEYAIAGGQDGLRVCLHEAALLKRARHPHIVEIVAIFADPEEHGFFIQMPFYDQGSLDRWVRENSPDDHSIRRVLSQVVIALAHLHGLGITHADIKPANILVDRRGVARLGDFDISVECSVRTSAARAHATMTQVGFTPGFAAPELLRTGASPASDIFALGATIAEVAPRSSDRDLLLQRLQHHDPAARPAAQQVLQDPYFAPVFAWARDERRNCCICLTDDIRFEDGLACGREDGEAHFVCRSCLEQHVHTSCTTELRLRQVSEGRVRCPGRPCDSECYPDVDLAKHLSASVFRRYTESRLDLLEQRKAAELEGEMQVRLNLELRLLHALDEQQRRVRAVRNHVVEEILTLKCPRCGQAFLDFVGCFALQCSRCPCGFCAWCGADSGGSNAHEHVRSCREKPQGADVFFGSFEQFEAAQRRRRRRLLQRFLPTLDAQTRHCVLNEMRRDLTDLGLGDLAGHHPIPGYAAAAV